MAEDIDKLIERLDDKCHRLICMVFAVAGLSTEDPRIDDFADDRGQGPDTINLCIDSGLIKQVGSADEGENFRLVPGWWPHSLPSEWRRLILGSLKQSCDIQSLRSRVSELEAERDDYRARLATWLNDYSRTADGYTVHVPVYQIEHFTRLAARSTGPQAQVRAETSVPGVFTDLSKNPTPDGWRLVPKEPTPEMIYASLRAGYIAVGGTEAEADAATAAKIASSSQSFFRACYSAMLAASPTPPAAEAVGGGDVYVAANIASLERMLADGGPEDVITAESIKQQIKKLQRERGAVAGQDGSSVSCALKGTGPAAPTAGCEDSQLLAAFDRCRAEIIDSSLCDASESLSSLVFSQLSDFRLRLHEYFLAKSGPAASTASDDVVEEVAVAILKVAPRLMERDAERIARAVLSSPPVQEIVEALADALHSFDGLERAWKGHAVLNLDETFVAVLRASSILPRFQRIGTDGGTANG